MQQYYTHTTYHTHAHTHTHARSPTHTIPKHTNTHACSHTDKHVLRYIHTYIHTYTLDHTDREREGERERDQLFNYLYYSNCYFLRKIIIAEFYGTPGLRAWSKSLPPRVRDTDIHVYSINQVKIILSCYALLLFSNLSDSVEGGEGV